MQIRTCPPSNTFSDWAAFELAMDNGRVAGNGVLRVRIDDQPLIVKNSGGDRRNYGWFRYALIALIIRHFVGERPDRAVLMRTNRERLAHEAARLNELKAAGVAVPVVHRHLPDLLVLQDVGDNIDQTLVPLAQSSRMALVEHIAEDLAMFHGAGHWHGAGQLRNMTLLDDRLYRIDFEKDLEGVLPLAHRQALDILLAAFSLAHHRGLEAEDQKEALIRRLVGSWRQDMGASPAVQEFDRMSQALKLPRALAEHLGAIKGRDVVAFRLLARSLLEPIRPRAMPAPL